MTHSLIFIGRMSHKERDNMHLKPRAEPAVSKNKAKWDLGYRDLFPSHNVM